MIIKLLVVLYMGSLSFFCLFLFLLSSQVNSQSVPTWTPDSTLRIGQAIVYDDQLITRTTTSQVNLTYFSATISPASAGVVISGMENFLSFEIYLNVSVALLAESFITIDIYLHDETFIRQLNLNYLVLESNATAEILVGNFYTFDLKEGSGQRLQQFANQTTSLTTDTPYIVSAVSGIQLYNEMGSANSFHIHSWIVGFTLYHIVATSTNNTLQHISIVTAVFPNASYYQDYSFVLVSTVLHINNDNDDFAQLDQMGQSGALDIPNTLFFGINGFSFTMNGERVFLLDDLNKTHWIDNLKSHEYNWVQIAVLMTAQKVCGGMNAYYYVEGYQCVADCTGYLDAGGNICKDCAPQCDECSGTIDSCLTCKPDLFRLPAGPSPSACQCDKGNGYVDVGKALCEKCSYYIPGCAECDQSDDCDICGAPFLRAQNNNTGKYFCQCPAGTYQVTDSCLPFPGCLQSNQIITGQYCEECDQANHFEQDSANNYTCICMSGYFLNNITQTCEDICGDELTPDGKCDDGNTVGGDGCSSNCLVELGWICTETTPHGKSICAEKKEITIDYLYAQRVMGQNQTVLVFLLQPDQSFLAPEAFYNSVSTNIPYAKKAVIFDPEKSLIYLTLDYTQTLEGQNFQVNFTFTGISIYSEDINMTVSLHGLNAKLIVCSSPANHFIIFYVSLALACLSLLLALTSAFIGQKMVGVELIFPVQAAFFTLIALPDSVFPAFEALWGLRFSNGYNLLMPYEYTDNYVLDPNLVVMRYWGEYLLNYNITFSLLGGVLLMLAAICCRMQLLEDDEKRLETILKDLDKKNIKGKDKPEIEEESELQSTKGNQKPELKVQDLEEELDDVRGNLKYWKNFSCMIFDRFLAILLLVTTGEVLFSISVQFSSFRYRGNNVDGPFSGFFMLITYLTVVSGLYALLYDYKTEKFVTYNCNKGKYAMFYIFLFVGYFVLLGSVFHSVAASYLSLIISLLPFVLIAYQKPYLLSAFLQMQNIIAFLNQLPFVTTAIVVVIANISQNTMSDQIAFMLAFVCLGCIGLSCVLAAVRLVKVVDCKRISCCDFAEGKKDGGNDRQKKKYGVTLLEVDVQKDLDEFSDNSVRAVLFDKRRALEDEVFNQQIKNKQGHESLGKKKIFEENMQHEVEDDEDLDELQRIKMKLRKQLKQKKNLGLIK